MNSPRLPLSNIRIADFGWMIAGPLATRVFANFGAEVIRIESGSRIDEIRVVGARPEGIESPNVAGVFNDINTSKLSVTLDLNTDEGLSLAKNVIEISDVVTNNFRGDRMGKWGLDYDNLKKIKMYFSIWLLGYNQQFHASLWKQFCRQCFFSPLLLRFLSCISTATPSEATNWALVFS